MAALPLYQMLSGLGDTIYSGFAEADKRRTLADLGKDIQSGNLEGASQKLLASGDIGSALKLVEMKRAQGNQQQLKEVLGQDPMMGGGVSAPGPQAQGGMRPEVSALGAIESGMNYGAVGPAVKKGDAVDHAYGFSQIMGKNIPQWTKEVLGYSMTPEQFLNDRGAQEKVTQAKFSSYLQQYGNPQDAASMWFSGRPMRQAGNVSDVTGTTVPKYVQRYNDALSKQGGGQPVQVADASGAVPQSAGGNDARENLLRFRTKLTSILPGLDQSSATAVQARIGDIDRRLSEMRSDTQYERSLAAEERRTQTQLLADERRAQRQLETEDRRSTRQLASEERRAALATEKAPTADQANAAGFFDRMRNAEQMFTDEKGNPTSVLNAMTGAGGAYNRVIGMLPGGNAAQSEDFQRADRAKEDFISAVLRKESGAAISEGEFAREDRKYFPQPGNSQKVIADKAKARQIAIQSMERTAGPALKASAPKQQQGGVEQLLQKLPPDRLAKAQKAMELGASEAEIMQALGIK
jgi:hypothetical protein